MAKKKKSAASIIRGAGKTKRATTPRASSAKDPDMPEFISPGRQRFIDRSLADTKRLGRITGPNGEGYDPNRTEREYGTTIDFSVAKDTRESGQNVNRYPGKCYNCDKSIAPGVGEPIHVSKIPQEKRRGTGEWGVRCSGGSCVTKSGKVKGPAERTINPAQGVTVQKAKIGKKGGGHHIATLLHEDNESSISWHPRSGIIQSINIHPEHADIGAVEHLMTTATSVAQRQGLSVPRYGRGQAGV